MKQKNNKKNIMVSVLLMVIVVFSGIFLKEANAKNNLNYQGLEDSHIIEIRQLREYIKNYYNAEANKQWNKTYNMRRTLFKESVTLFNYSRLMDKQTAGWTLKSVKIIRSKEGKVEFSESSAIDVVFVEMLFEEIAGGSFFMQEYEREDSVEMDKKKLSVETTIWLSESEQWKCLKCGTRGHIFLNLPLALE